ncbi:MAG: DUF421 domain-containing protein [Bacillota bacterium]|nr:DUF421 domain-containing protein [Bacillota bacterium]
MLEVRKLLPDYLLVFFRSIIAAFTLLILARMLGKKQISQLSFFEYVLGITIGSIAATMSTDLSNRALPEFVGLITWALLALLIELIALKNRKLGKILDGEPVILVENGKLMEDRLGMARYRFADLVEQLREKSVFNLSDVEFAVLETDGSLSVLKKSQVEPITPQDLNIPTSYQGLEVELIEEGQIIDQNLKQIKKDQKWLLAELQQRGIKLHQVAYGSLDTSGRLFLDLYKDDGVNIIDTSDYEGPN